MCVRVCVREEKIEKKRESARDRENARARASARERERESQSERDRERKRERESNTHLAHMFALHQQGNNDGMPV